VIKKAFVKREERKIKEEQQRQIRIEQMQKKVGEMKRKEDAKVLKEVSEKKIKNSWWNKFFKIEL